MLSHYQKTFRAASFQKQLTHKKLHFCFITDDCNDAATVDEEKKQREHLLALNQVIARQVMEKSRMVAGIKPQIL